MKKFIFVFGGAISQSAPHIYVSALPFAPQRSLVSKQYKRDYLGTISIRGGGQTDWPAIQAVLANDINSAAFSPVVSGLSDKLDQVWNAVTSKVAAGPFEGRTGPV